MMITAVDLDGSVKGGGHSERIDPGGVPTGILSIHSARYRFASQYCGGLRVLDVACGAGYGAAALSATAGSVIGVDIDEEALCYAREKYSGSKLRFQLEDATALSFADGSFDLVVSFETIEHLRDIPRFLGEVRRVLSTGGRFIVSTPRVKRTTWQPENPHHTVEFAVGDFEKLLKDHFQEVALFGQERRQNVVHYWLQKLDLLNLRYRIPRKIRHAVDRGLGTRPFEEMTEQDQVLVETVSPRAHVVVAVCMIPNVK